MLSITSNQKPPAKEVPISHEPQPSSDRYLSARTMHDLRLKMLKRLSTHLRPHRSPQTLPASSAALAS